MLFEDSMFDEWLDSEAKRVYEKFKGDEALTPEDKIVLVLKSQSNHFHHLDIELREKIDALKKDMDQKFEDIDKRFEKIDQKFEDIDKRFEKIDERFEKIDERFEKIDEKFANINEQFVKLHSTINMQTWKMIGAIGLIAVFIKLADSLPFIMEFIKSN